VVFIAIASDHINIYSCKLPSQEGKGSDQLPFCKHSLCMAPLRTNPRSQVWVTTEPKVVLVPSVSPFIGSPGLPQSIAA